MLDLELRIEDGTLIEPIADAEHRARQIELGEAGIVNGMHVVDLTVPPQAQVRRDATGRRGALGQLRLCRLLLLLRGQRLVLRLELLLLGLELIELPLHLSDLLFKLFLVHGGWRISGVGAARHQACGGQGNAEEFSGCEVHGS